MILPDVTGEKYKCEDTGEVFLVSEYSLGVQIVKVVVPVLVAYASQTPK